MFQFFPLNSNYNWLKKNNYIFFTIFWNIYVRVYELSKITNALK